MSDAETEPQRHPGGRPTKYEERFCEEVEADMAEGYSLTAFAGKIGVCRATLENWTKEHPEFLASVSRGKALRLREWETMGIAIAKKGAGGPGGATMVVFGLKNMGGEEWRDKQEVEHSGTVGVTRSERVIVDPADPNAAGVRPASEPGPV